MLTKKALLARARSEHGTTLVLMSLLLVALMGMSALVLDLGNARRVKRSAQGTSDSAALAAAPELGNTSLLAATRMANAANVARTYAERNLPAPPGGWTPATWSTCTDTTPLPVASTISPCISFDDATIPTKVRVKVPTQQVQAQFAGAIGQGAPVAVSAGATAGIASSQGSFQGRMVIPIAHGPKTNTTWTSRTWRLFSRSSPSPGSALIYDDSNLSTWDKSCRQVNGDPPSDAACVFKSPRLASFITEVGANDYNALRVNLAMGLDHDLGTYPPNSPIAGPPTRVCDGPTVASPCSTTNVVGGVPTGAVANHVITAQGRRWTWSSSLGKWQSEDTGSWNSWRDAVDEGLIIGDGNSNKYFTLGSTQFCSRLMRPALTDVNANTTKPNDCNPDTPTITLRFECGLLLCYNSRKINGRHIGYYLTPAAKTHFFGSPGPGGSSTVCGNDPYPDPDPALDNVDHSRWNGTIETRLTAYMSQTSASPYPCNSAPQAPIFDASITRDPRFAWIAVIQSECSDSGWEQSWWDWSWRDTWNWNRTETNCATTTPKYILEYRAIYMDTIQMYGPPGLWATHIDKVYAWEFDPALIAAWTSVGQPSTGSPIEYQGGPAIPVLTQ